MSQPETMGEWLDQFLPTQQVYTLFVRVGATFCRQVGELDQMFFELGASPAEDTALFLEWRHRPISLLYDGQVVELQDQEHPNNYSLWWLDQNNAADEMLLGVIEQLSDKPRRSYMIAAKHVREARRVAKELDRVALATPTGPTRDLLTEARDVIEFFLTDTTTIAYSRATNYRCNLCGFIEGEHAPSCANLPMDSSTIVERE